MKLSEMSTRQAAQCMVNLAAPIGTLVKNPAVKEYMHKAANKEATIETLMDAFAELVPIFLRDHFDELAYIVSALTGKTPDEVGDQTVLETLTDVKSSIDGEFLRFFTKSPGMDQAGC